MNTAILDSPDSVGTPFRNFSLIGEEAPVPLLLSRRDASTAPFRRAAEEKKARIEQNEALSHSQRHNALEMLRQQTEVEMRRALGDRNFHAFKTFNQWWFREIFAENQNRWQTSGHSEPMIGRRIQPGDGANTADRREQHGNVAPAISDNNTTR